LLVQLSTGARNALIIHFRTRSPAAQRLGGSSWPVLSSSNSA